MFSKESNIWHPAELYQLSVVKSFYNNRDSNNKNYTIRPLPKQSEGPTLTAHVSGEQSSLRQLKEERLMLGVSGGLSVLGMEVFLVPAAIHYSLSGDVEVATALSSALVAFPAVIGGMLHYLNAEIHKLEERLQGHN